MNVYKLIQKIDSFSHAEQQEILMPLKDTRVGHLRAQQQLFLLGYVQQH